LHRGGTLHRHLRWRKKYRKRYGGRDLRGRIAHRISIEQRPAIVEKRSRIGDWELDTIVGVRSGSGAALVSLCERKSRLTLLAQVEKATAQAAAKASLHSHFRQRTRVQQSSPNRPEAASGLLFRLSLLLLGARAQ
jgi:IS30 family transposase